MIGKIEYNDRKRTYKEGLKIFFLLLHIIKNISIFNIFNIEILRMPENIKKEKILTAGSWIIIVFFSMLAILTIIVAWWYYFFEVPTSAPSAITITYDTSVSPQEYIYDINWTNNDSWPCSYSYSIIDSSSNKILYSGITESTTIQTPSLYNGTYLFSLSAQAKTWFSVKKKSGEVTIQFIINNPDSVYSQKEVFLVAGQDSSGDWETFTDSDSASQVCQSANGSILASSDQLTSAFEDGADWWLYGWYNNTNSNSNALAYPCWFSSRGCKEGKAGIVYGGDSGLGHVTCYGVKPSQGKPLNIPSNLIKNSNITSILPYDFSACQGRYYKRDLPSKNTCTCDLKGCSS